MRWLLGLSFVALATVALALSLIADPYTTWGDPPKVRTSVAYVSSNLAIACLIILAFAGAILFWKAPHRKAWKAIAITMPLLILGASSMARIVWIHFHVLA